MVALSDKWIKKMAINNNTIEPFISNQIRSEDSKKVISYGVSSYSYDARVADEFKIFINIDSAVVDFKNFTSNSFVTKKGESCITPPNSFALASTIEYFKIPEDVIVICVGKSTYARCGIIVNLIPLEPRWKGHVALEFSNITPLSAKIYAFEGACQFIFFKSSESCEVSYNTRQGKYMKQEEVTLQKV